MITVSPKTRQYKKLVTAMNKAIKDICENDSHVTAVEIHGPHSGYTIEFQGFGKEHLWLSTEIEK